MKKIPLFVAAAVLTMTAATPTFAAELPAYEKAGLPISLVQLQALGAANAQQQYPVATSAASPHQLSVLTPRSKITATTSSPSRTQTIGRVVR